MTCANCGKEISEDQAYQQGGKTMCEGCAMQKGLFPLGHTGARRDGISEEGRILTIPKP